MSSFTIGNYFESFIAEQISVGRYNNASEVVREGLRLVEEREKKFFALKKELTEAIERGGSHTPEAVIRYIKTELAGDK